jgi:hypothetical protein
VEPRLGRPHIEVADILREYGNEYRRVYSPSPAQCRVLRHIETCRTAALGGHKDTCTNCGYVRISYNSCRDRHCPKCQSLKRAEWLEERKKRLLPIPYFHVVFTLPSQLNALSLCNKRVLFDILFSSAAETLKTIAADKKHLGAKIGFTAILHTWGQNLQFHPHLHCVVTGGGLAADGKSWVSTSMRFFLSVKVLAKLFRGKFLHKLKRAYREGTLELGGSTAELRDAAAWKRFLDTLYGVDWVVYSKPPFGGPQQVFRYLGRYTHRVAISNHRLEKLEDGKVTFAIKDYADGEKRKSLTLDACEFIRRFLLHVLPQKFVRIRHYGLIAGRNVDTLLALARKILPSEPQVSEEAVEVSGEWWERLLSLTGFDVFACPECRHGNLVRTPLPQKDSVFSGSGMILDSS